jgi:hypothetical protein
VAGKILRQHRSKREGTMNCVVRLLVSMSLLFLVDGTVHTARAFPAGRFIEARNLTQAEKAAVNRLSRFTGKNPWLIFGFRFGVNPRAGRDSTSLTVFMDPDAENGRLRRGRVVSMAFAPPKPGQPSSWHVVAVTKYAHVAVVGKAAGDVKGQWDAAMPFTLPDEFDDATIVSLVDFIRTNPERPPMPRVDGSMAITTITRFANGLQVDMQDKPWQGYNVLVERRREGWVVLQVRAWIA